MNIADRIDELEAKLPARLGQWAKLFAAAEMSFDVDAFLLAAICDRESRGGAALLPRGPAGTGDKGHGRGLMQIDDRYHRSFIQASTDNGVPLWQQPVYNIIYAAHLYSRYRSSFSGDELAALASYNAGPGNVREVYAGVDSEATDAERIKLLDQVTAGNNYVSDVLRRRAGFVVKPGVT